MMSPVCDNSHGYDRPFGAVATKYVFFLGGFASFATICPMTIFPLEIIVLVFMQKLAITKYPN